MGGWLAAFPKQNIVHENLETDSKANGVTFERGLLGGIILTSDGGPVYSPLSAMP